MTKGMLIPRKGHEKARLPVAGVPALARYGARRTEVTRRAPTLCGGLAGCASCFGAEPAVSTLALAKWKAGAFHRLQPVDREPFCETPSCSACAVSGS
jgi:hypothetical protein